MFFASVPRLSSRALAWRNQSDESLSRQPDKSQRNQQDAAQKRQELQARIPTIDYVSPEPTDSAEKAKRRKRNKHYDGKNLVMTNPSGSGTATIVDDDRFSSLPALPVTQSDVILTADVLNSGAHLSNDKSGVYSEFNVQIDTVLKGTVSSLSQTNLISLSRQGGVVRYPSGRTELYLIAHQNMPAIGKRYLFFLKTTDDPQAYEIVTGYEIGPERVLPLDWGRQFESFRGTDLVAFLNSVREAIAKK
jgi:hypothetical protein